MSFDTIEIRGAREHNLKNINLTIPRGKMVVITGLSGSGKSSLAFDTIYAEGQRRYVESLSAYARQFLEQMDKPDVDSIEGLSPAISIEQKTTSKNPRSTVGTVTEIYDYLRVLYARVGLPHCTECGKPIQSQTVQQMTDRVMDLPQGTKLEILSPVVRGRKGHYKALFEEFKKLGFVRVRVDGELRELSEDFDLDKKKAHTIEVVVDRISVKPEARARVAEGLELALSKAEGLAIAQLADGERILFSELFSCPDCGVSIPEMTPRAFSFNSPHGACQDCDGLGSKVAVDPARIIDPEKSVLEGAVIPWDNPLAGWYRQVLASVVSHYGEDPETKWKHLPEKVRHAILHGTGRESVKFRYEGGKSIFRTKKPFDGVVTRLLRKIKESETGEEMVDMEPFLEVRPCESCHGARLRPESLAVTVSGLSIDKLTALPVKEAMEFFSRATFSDRDEKIASRVLKEIKSRLGFLEDVGLGYLALDRSSGTLSGGESQRIRLATQVGSRLTGVLYILDEPTIGLHHRDNQRLIQTLKELKTLGNTVILVEHDEDTMLAADHIIDMGPGAGEFGGEIVAQGSPDEIMNNPASITGAYLSGRKSIEIPFARRKSAGASLVVKGATGHNLKGDDLVIPLGLFTAVTGVSGSGKSSLVVDTLLPALNCAVMGSHDRPLPHKEIKGLEHIDKVVDVNQSPIGRTPRSNPATYTGLFTLIRDLFTKLPEARTRGYSQGRFSFNVKGGRCEACKGDGLQKIEMHFLPDVYVVCEQCSGSRYNHETLQIRYKGASIADVLNMTVTTARQFFANVPSLTQKLATLEEVGLGYIRLGQSSTTLSGGEAQRIKLAKELSRRQTGKTFYVLDEPTTGLHFDDVKKLLEVLQKLVEGGNTVVVIEHNLDVIKTADHLIDLGPDGGDAGGRIVAQGSPEEIAKNFISHTATALGHLFVREKARSLS